MAKIPRYNSTTIRIASVLIPKLRLRAASVGVSMNAYISMVIAADLEKYEMRRLEDGGISLEKTKT